MVCGAGLYFLRSFKPALARDYDVFFAAIGLLCGGILFFQAWRLDPILQFGQFLLAGTTVFFAYESVRLRGISADQARRSSYFDDEPDSPGINPRESTEWNDNYESYDKFEEFQPRRRRFSSQPDLAGDSPESELYRPRRTTRAAIPEQAASRRPGRRNEDPDWNEESERARRMARFTRDDENGASPTRRFGERRDNRQEQRRGSRPTPSPQRQGRQQIENDPRARGNTSSRTNPTATNNRGTLPEDSPIRQSQSPEDAAFAPARSRSGRINTSTTSSSQDIRNKSRRSSSTSYSQSPQSRKAPRDFRPRDNNSRFDN